MNTKGLTLLVPEKADPERDLVASAWIENEGKVERIGRFWDPPDLKSDSIRIYGNDTFAYVLAQKLNVALISPDDNVLLSFNEAILKRKIEKKDLSAANYLDYPIFIKSIVPKQFRAGVYVGFEEFYNETKGLLDNTGILISEVVQFVAEARFFILGKKILDGAIYEGTADLGTAKAFVERVIGSGDFPKTFVLDVGFIEKIGWAVVELNAAWGAGLNGCKAELILPAIEAATRKSK